MSRRKGRELALQILFQMDFNDSPLEETLTLFWKVHKVGLEARGFAESLVRGVRSGQAEIDGLLQRFARHWRLERMTAVDRNILRIAVSEFLRQEAPASVVIDEAIEVARKYGTEKSPEFVNGILDAVRLELEGSRKR